MSSYPYISTTKKTRMISSYRSIGLPLPHCPSRKAIPLSSSSTTKLSYHFLSARDNRRGAPPRNSPNPSSPRLLLSPPPDGAIRRAASPRTSCIPLPSRPPNARRAAPRFRSIRSFAAAGRTHARLPHGSGQSTPSIRRTAWRAHR